MRRQIAAALATLGLITAGLVTGAGTAHAADTATFYWPVSGNVPDADVAYHHTWEKGASAIDIGADLGVDVKPAQTGVVITASRGCADSDSVNCGGGDESNGFGNYVVIRHDRPGVPAPLYTLYGHMAADSITVVEGQTVELDTTLGQIAMSGSTDGPHVHFAIGTCDHPWTFRGVNCTIWNAPDVAMTATAGKPMPGTYPQLVSPAPLCTITGFTPHKAVMGIRPITVHTMIKTTGCTVTAWKLEADAGEMFGTNDCIPVTEECWDSDPAEVIDPLAGIPLSMAGVPVPVDASARDQNGVWNKRRFPTGFTLQRKSIWRSFDVTRQGPRVTVDGRLMVAMWSPNPRFIGYSAQTVLIQRRASAGAAWKTVKSLRTEPDGRFSTKVLALTGNWRATFASSAAVAPAAATLGTRV